MPLVPAAKFLALDLSPMLMNNIGWVIAGLVIVIGLFIVGFADVIRFRPRRLWAISGVCFDESIRRRILWITPLAILGVIVVAQLQKPLDEQDAIRQTTKFCLFATGLVVTISTIILACSNLPREIENRVIYTVVTKPTTRLEIVLGKIVGFARVSAAILFIMGLFTWGYLHLRSIALEHGIQDRIKTGETNQDPLSLPTLQHYVDAGLLNAKTFATTSNVQVYARMPVEGDPRRYFNTEGTVFIPFALPENMAAAASEEDDKSTVPGMFIHLHGIGYALANTATPKPSVAASSTTQQFTGLAPLISSTRPAGVAPAKAPVGPPQITVQFFDFNQNTIPGTESVGSHPYPLASPDNNDLTIPVSISAVRALSKFPVFYVTVTGGTSGFEYWLNDQPAELIIPVAGKPAPLTVTSADPRSPGHPWYPLFYGRIGTAGQQMHGDSSPEKTPVAIYSFRNAGIATSPVPIELRLGIERGGDDPTSTDSPTRVSLQVHNYKTDQFTDPVDLKPENNRTAYVTIPNNAVDGGNFDIIIRCLTQDHWITFNASSLQIVKAETAFSFNLFKSLLIIWLLSVLVTSISIFSSTFLSWPIAVVFTLVILLGRWGVQELGDAATAGLGRQFVQDFGVRDPAQAQALSATVDKLNQLLNVVATVLPDITQFSATEDIERGISIPPSKINDAFWVVLGFGLPLSVLAYVFLKNKEVAP